MKNLDYKNYQAPDHLWTPKIWLVLCAIILAICLVSWLDNQDRERVRQAIQDKDQHIASLEQTIKRLETK